MGRRVVPVIELVHDLTVSQACLYLATQGIHINSRTLHRWIKSNYVHAYHRHGVDREWRVPKESIALIVSRRRRAA